jgi:glycosyltransferase involved in cell wall biosynthesis
MLYISVIIPVYNRPDEIEEMLESLSKQTYNNFEVVIVEDGSTIPCKDIALSYSDKLHISYYFKENEKPAIARNFGMKHAKGNYFIFFDSDCIVPPHYMETIHRELNINYTDAFGGPDKANESFSLTQKAINYAMTSFLTTGGIRGAEKIDKYYPRSFNMGISKKIFDNTTGFPITTMHPGEDMVFSIEIIERGFTTRLIPQAYVYHKRRTSLGKFYKQVYRFGKTRYIISRFYPGTFKIFYLFPSCFVLGCIALLLSAIWCLYAPLLILLFALLAFCDSLLRNKNFAVAVLSIVSSFYQLFAYGLGFMNTMLGHVFLKRNYYGVFGRKFY